MFFVQMFMDPQLGKLIKPTEIVQYNLDMVAQCSCSKGL